MVETQVIVAPGFRGHRLQYAALLAQEVVRQGRRPRLLLLRGTSDSSEYATHIAHLGQECTITEIDRMTPSNIREAVAGDSRYPTVISEADSLLIPLARSFPRWPGGTNSLMLRGSGQARIMAVRGLQTVGKAAARNAIRIATDHNPFVLRSFSTPRLASTEVRDPVIFVGSPDVAAVVRHAWDAEAGKLQRAHAPTRWVGVVGAIGHRKNLGLVAQAVARLGPHVGLVVAGQAETTEQQISAWLTPVEGSNTVVRISRQLTDLEFDSIVLALDCVVVAHSNEGPSGVFAKAWASGTRVVAAGARSLRRDTANMGGLAAWTELDVKPLAVAIGQATESGRVSTPVRSNMNDEFARRLVSAAHGRRI